MLLAGFSVFPSYVGRPELPGIIVGMVQVDSLHRARRRLRQWHLLDWLCWYFLLALCSLLSLTGPRCSASWPVCTNRTVVRSFLAVAFGRSPWSRSPWRFPSCSSTRWLCPWCKGRAGSLCCWRSLELCDASQHLKPSAKVPISSCPFPLAKDCETWRTQIEFKRGLCSSLGFCCFQLTVFDHLCSPCAVRRDTWKPQGCGVTQG